MWKLTHVHHECVEYYTFQSNMFVQETQEAKVLFKYYYWEINQFSKLNIYIRMDLALVSTFSSLIWVQVSQIVMSNIHFFPNLYIQAWIEIKILKVEVRRGKGKKVKALFKGMLGWIFWLANPLYICLIFTLPIRWACIAVALWWLSIFRWYPNLM